MPVRCFQRAMQPPRLFVVDCGDCETRLSRPGFSAVVAADNRACFAVLYRRSTAVPDRPPGFDRTSLVNKLIFVWGQPAVGVT